MPIRFASPPVRAHHRPTVSESRIKRITQITQITPPPYRRFVLPATRAFPAPPRRVRNSGPRPKGSAISSTQHP